MRRVRIIPVLLLHKGGLVKSRKFKNYQYLGDPINAVRIFNEKEADELIILDIDASRLNAAVNVSKIREIVSEAFMPISYGGGIKTLEEAKDILNSGVEKVVLNRSAVLRPVLINEVSKLYGSQSVVISIDVKKNLWGRYKVYTSNGTINTGFDPAAFALQCQAMGAGEIFLNAIERDGTYRGFDIELVKYVSSKLTIPLIACGGAANLEDFSEVISKGQASGVAAGSMFVFQRPHNAVLISYPDNNSFKTISKKINEIEKNY